MPFEIPSPARRESLPLPMGVRLTEAYLSMRDIGDEEMKRAFPRIIKQARDEYVKFSRVLPAEVPSAEQLLGMIDVDKIIGKDQNPDPAETYAKIVSSVTTLIDRWNKAKSAKKAA